MKKVGLIAGSGKFPLLFAQNAVKNNCKVYTIALKEETNPDIEKYSHKVKWVHLGEFKKAIMFFVLHMVKHLVMAGKVEKKKIFTDIDKDEEMQDFMNSIKDKRDNTLLAGIINKVEKLGFKFIDSTTFLKEYMSREGVMTKREPDEREKKDIAIGFKLAKEMSGQEIGQTVIVKDTVILAIEAIEGTDEAIKRAAAWGGPGAVVVKVSRPNQDMRFDVPVVGESTIDVLIENKISALAIEADKMLFLDKEAVIAKADEAGIAIIGIMA